MRRAELVPRLRITGADDQLILKHRIAKPSPEVAYFQLAYNGKRQRLVMVISRTQRRGGPKTVLWNVSRSVQLSNFRMPSVIRNQIVGVRITQYS